MAELAVIGLGRFGRAVARGLTRRGQAVLAVDRDPTRLEAVANEVESTATADTTDERQVAGLGLDRVAAVVVTIGSRAREASLLTVAILVDLGVTRVVARAFDDRHARLLLAIGATEVLNPEVEIGQRLADHLAYPGILDQFGLGTSRRTVVARIECPEAFAGRRLAELEEVTGSPVRLLAIERGDDVVPAPGDQELLASGDRLVVLGEAEAVAELAVLR